jgi:hypothetical protein
VGAWGTGNFENDDAADWIAGLEEAEGIQPVVVALRSAIADGYLEAPDCTTALAAAEVVAAIRGKPATNLPKAAAGWIRQHHPAVDDEVLRLARQAVHRIGTQSELLELWQDSDELEDWLATLKDLEHRLGVD